MTPVNTTTADFGVEATFTVQAYDVDGAGLAHEAAHLRWLAALRDALLCQALSEISAPYVPRLVTSCVGLCKPASRRRLTRSP